jgi:hypothetical protein
LSTFKVGQIWQRTRAELAAPEEVIVHRVIEDEFAIAVCHDRRVPAEQVHPFDIVLIAATRLDLERWELVA